MLIELDSLIIEQGMDDIAHKAGLDTDILAALQSQLITVVLFKRELQKQLDSFEQLSYDSDCKGSIDMTDMLYSK